MALTKQEILDAIAERAKTVRTVDVPEWGGEVCIRRLSAADVDRSGLSSGRRDAAVFAKVIAYSITDDDGKRLFTEKDAQRMADVDMATTARVFGECMRVNGLMDDDLEAAVSTFTSAQNEPSSTG